MGNGPKVDVLELCDRAAKMLKAAGFVFHCTSRETEATYYRWPDRQTLLRVATHGRNKRPMKSLGLNEVGAYLTFHPHNKEQGPFLKMSDEALHCRVATAIGLYFMKCAKVKP